MQNNKLALPILLLAAFLFSMSGVFNRMIGGEAGAFTGLMARTIIPAMLFGLFLIVSRERIIFANFSRRDISLFALRTFLTLIDFLTFFYAINRMELGITLLVFYVSYMLVSYIYTVIDPNENVKLKDGLALVMALFGIGLIYEFDLSEIEFLPTLAATVTGTAYALSTALSKPLTKKHSVALTNFITYIATGIISLPLFVIAYSVDVEKVDLPLSVEAIAGIIFIGINTFGTFFLTIYGYKITNVNRASLILLSEIVFTFIIGFIVYDEAINDSVIFGTLFVIIALALPYIKKK